MSNKEAFDRANPNTIADLLRNVGIGQILRGQLPQQLRRKTPALATNILATLQSFALPNDCKAASIVRAYARATTAAGTLGELAIQAANATPADAQIAVAPNGDIVVLAASAYTQVDVTFLPSRGDVVVLTDQEVVANVFTIPAALTARGVVYLVNCTATAAGATGAKIVLVPGGAPAAGQCSLTTAKAGVTFAAADAVTRCTVTLLVATDQDLDTILESATGETL